MTAEEALAIYIDNKFTEEQYIDIQQTSKVHNANIYPTYNRCEENVSVWRGETAVTTQRLVAAQKDVPKKRLEEYDPNKITIAFKWRCDWASGHSQNMQGFENSDNDTFNDNSIENWKPRVDIVEQSRAIAARFPIQLFKTATYVEHRRK
ncbi:hypothetical protein J437_LFUL012791 [Ladona fulva]|uniref:Uncharacterized protein n=1 Tax=Ladona fulva TaxID=123851 RepID=A0A8K0KFU9_LADFU|nr:hypothetical protein J437_LFUL012791 [Ladona fulva]